MTTYKARTMKQYWKYPVKGDYPRGSWYEWTIEDATGKLMVHYQYRESGGFRSNSQINGGVLMFLMFTLEEDPEYTGSVDYTRYIRVWAKINTIKAIQNL